MKKIYFITPIVIAVLAGAAIGGYYLLKEIRRQIIYNELVEGKRIINEMDARDAAEREAKLIKGRIQTPSGYERTPFEYGSFGEYLRNLPLKPGNPPVLLYNGQKKGNQNAHFAVVDMEIGDKDLEQCADAVIRLRAEYLFQEKRFEDIHFNFTSGDRAHFAKWVEGFRPKIAGNDVSWIKSAPADSSYRSFREYLDVVFKYAGSSSLEKELVPVKIEAAQIGDVFIHGGYPGHAVIIVDMAVDAAGRKIFLLAQSYMPAQEIHVLKNPRNPALSPWYLLDFGEDLFTPEWMFKRTELARFPQQ